MTVISTSAAIPALEPDPDRDPWDHREEQECDNDARCSEQMQERTS